MSTITETKRNISKKTYEIDETQLDSKIESLKHELEGYLITKYKKLYGYNIGDIVINRNDDIYRITSFDWLKCQFRGQKKKKDGLWGVREEYFDNPLDYPENILSKKLIDYVD